MKLIEEKSLIAKLFLNSNNIKHYSRNKYLAAVFAERFDGTIGDLLKGPILEQSNASWIDVLPVITKQSVNRCHSSIKLTPIQGSLKKDEGFVYKHLSDIRDKVKPKFGVNILVRTAY